MIPPEAADFNLEPKAKAADTDYRRLLKEAQSEIKQQPDPNREQLHQLPILASHQAEILLVEHGLKPATFDLVRLGSPKYEALVAYAQQANMPHVTMRSPDDPADDTVLIGYGSTPETAREVAQAFWREPSELGTALGFPATAVEAYANKTCLSFEDEDAVVSDETAPFVSFRLSQQHWREELRVAEAWRDSVKALDPELYQAAVEESKAKKASSGGAPN